METQNQLTTTSGFSAPAVQDQNMQTQVEISRAVQEVQGMIISAKKFPRDEFASYNRIMKSCDRLTLASQSVYKLPIGGKTQEGPSIRLAETLATSWGNLSFGIQEFSRVNGKSSCQAYCHDYETNTRAEINFEVEHFIEIGKNGSPKSKKFLTDPVEIDRLIANRGARKLRNCILNIIPSDIVEDALKKCKQTVAKGGGLPIEDRIKTMVLAFDSIQVNTQMLEEYLKHPLANTSGEEIADLQAIYKAIIDKQSKRSDYFNVGEDSNETKKSKLNGKLKGESDADDQA